MTQFTDAQMEEVKRLLKEAEKKIHADYDKKAHAFREWFNDKAKEHDGVWVARRAAALTVAVVVAIQGGGWWLFTFVMSVVGM